MSNPAPAILTALSSAWERISVWFGRSQAEQAKQQQTEIDAMDKEIQAMKGTNDGTRPQATETAAVPVAVDGRG